MKETQIDHESIRNGFNHLKIDDFSGEELKRIRLIKKEQEKLSKLKTIVLASFLLSITFLFFILRIKQEQIFISLWFFYPLIIFLLGLLVIMLKKYNYENPMHNFWMAVLLIVIMICWGSFKKQYIPEPGWNMNNYIRAFIILLGYVINIFVSLWIYKKVFLFVAKKIDKDASYKVNLFNLMKNKHFYYSITYLMATELKKEIEEITKNLHSKEYSSGRCFLGSVDKFHTRIEVILNSRIYKHYLIIFLNWINLIKTVIFAFIIIGLIGYEGFIIYTLIAFFFFHFISRTIEIFYAFYKDIVRVDSKTFYNGIIKKSDNMGIFKYVPVYINDWKNSAIRKPMRISLAIHSIIEVVLSFSLIYYFAALTSAVYPTGFKLDFNYTWSFNSYLKMLLYSTSVSFFNFSFPTKSLLLCVLHIWQLLISIVLISLSIASYMGRDDKLTDRESRYFFYIDTDIKHPKE
ncbi:hypothetical protein [Priestia megaterium]|uniref:hypothetical protein n=1 Tax=Priestia megaterium TaxID=1404 RepID=UPI00301D93DE